MIDRRRWPHTESRNERLRLLSNACTAPSIALDNAATLLESLDLIDEAAEVRRLARLAEAALRDAAVVVLAAHRGVTEEMRRGLERK